MDVCMMPGQLRPENGSDVVFRFFAPVWVRAKKEKQLCKYLVSK